MLTELHILLFSFFDIVEVCHDEMWGKYYGNSIEKFNFRPVSAVIPSSVTDNFRGGYYIGLALNLSVELEYYFPHISGLF